MKRGLILALVLFAFSFNFVYAEPCQLEASLLNQDPYPAVPGEYTKIVFQIDGLNNPECRDVYFELLEGYPITIDSSSEKKVQIKGGTYTKDYSSHLMAPYKVIIDQDALDGDTPIKVRFSSLSSNLNSSSIEREFNINVKQTKTDFEIFTKEYNYQTKAFTIEIVNIGKIDIKALTVEIPQEEHIQIQGANKNVVGDVDSNEYTTAEFTAIPKDGDIKVLLTYTDEINVRRTLEKTITFDSRYFVDTQSAAQKNKKYFYLLLIVILAALIFWWHRRMIKKRKAKKL